MDPSSVIFSVVFLKKKTKYIYKIRFSYHHSSLDSFWVAWIQFSCKGPTIIHNKALWEGFNVRKHHKCFILPMHRLCCLKERLLYSVPAPVCAASLMSFMFTSLLPFSFSIPPTSLGSVGWGCSTIVLIVCRIYEWIWVIVCFCVKDVCAPRSVFCMQCVLFC